MSFEKAFATLSALGIDCYRENGGIVVTPLGLRLWAETPDEAFELALAYVGED